MNLDLNLDLARAAAALPGWRWMAGMVGIVSRAAPLEDIKFRRTDLPQIVNVRAVPDYRDPATAGCLLSMLGDDALFVEKAAPGMGWLHILPLLPRQDYAGSDCYPTLGEACIRAANARGGWGER